MDRAERLGLVGQDVTDVVLAAELHDVGKLAIPDDVLGKPGPLDADELAFLRRHTLIGERIVGAAPALGPVPGVGEHTGAIRRGFGEGRG